MGHTTNERTTKSATPGTCELCGEAIDAGTTYDTWDWHEDKNGAPRTIDAHRSCNIVRAELDVNEWHLGDTPLVEALADRYGDGMVIPRKVGALDLVPDDLIAEWTTVWNAIRTWLTEGTEYDDELPEEGVSDPKTRALVLATIGKREGPAAVSDVATRLKLAPILVGFAFRELLEADEIHESEPGRYSVGADPDPDVEE